MDETTTDAAAQDAGVTTTQPDEQPAEAVTTPDSEPQQPEAGTEPDTESDNPETPESKTYTSEWLASKGIDPASPDAVEKALNMAYNSEKVMSRTRQQSSELEKKVATAPQAQGGEMSTTDLLVGAMLFKQTTQVSPEQDTTMGDYLTQNPNKLALLRSNLITYDDVYHMSGAAAMGQPDAATLKGEGAQEALRQLSNKQSATAPKGNASHRTPPPAEDPILAVLQSD